MAKKNEDTYYKVINAVIVDNLPYCGDCNTLLDGGTIDYK